MDNKQIFDVLCLNVKKRREDLLKKFPKASFSSFCTTFVSEILSKTIPSNTFVEHNFTDHCLIDLKTYNHYVSEIENIKTVTSWMRYRNISFDTVITSAEAAYAYQILLTDDLDDKDYQIAGEFFKMTILLMDVKQLSSYGFFIRRFLEIDFLFTQEIIERAKAFCQIYTALGEKVFQQPDENFHQNEKILSILCLLAKSKVLCEIMYTFWKKLPSYLKNNRRYKFHGEEVVRILLNHCQIGDEMETNSTVGLLVSNSYIITSND